jgi:hypothetical protein
MAGIRQKPHFVNYLHPDPVYPKPKLMSNRAKKVPRAKSWDFKGRLVKVLSEGERHQIVSTRAGAEQALASSAGASGSGDISTPYQFETVLEAEVPSV